MSDDRSPMRVWTDEEVDSATAYVGQHDPDLIKAIEACELADEPIRDLGIKLSVLVQRWAPPADNFDLINMQFRILSRLRRRLGL
jgi:hypothetical protein